MTSERYDYFAAGRNIVAAAPGAWRDYDADDPDPGYFQFDWLSARHPDLYHRFALSTDGAVEVLAGLVEFPGRRVCDVGAGTGRSAIAAGAAGAGSIVAIDLFDSVIRFGEARVRESGLPNVTYVAGDNARLPLADASVDLVMAIWATLDWKEALRVVRPGGWIAHVAEAPGALAGELTALLNEGLDPSEATAPAEWFAADCPPADLTEAFPGAGSGKIVGGVRHIHDFTHVSRYDDSAELAAILGRLYGQRAAAYVRERNQATLAWRLRARYARRAP